MESINIMKSCIYFSNESVMKLLLRETSTTFTTKYCQTELLQVAPSIVVHSQYLVLSVSRHKYSPIPILSNTGKYRQMPNTVRHRHSNPTLVIKQQQRRPILARSECKQFPFSALTLLVGRQEGIQSVKSWGL